METVPLLAIILMVVLIPPLIIGLLTFRKTKEKYDFAVGFVFSMIPWTVTLFLITSDMWR